MHVSQRRLLQLFAFLAAWALIVIARLVHVQLVRHEHYVARAQRQQERTLDLNPVRGAILDSRERVLAESVPAESIYADPQAITDRAAVARKLAKIKAIGLTARELEGRLRGDNSFAWIARQLPLEVSAEVKKLQLPGIYFLESRRRSYPRATLAANVIGYVGVDGTGLGGIEHSFDEHIKGTPGKVTLLKDARKAMYLVGGDGPNRPRDGHHVVLTLDSVIQFIAERSLEKAMKAWRATGGSVIVMDPNDGAILAMASYPTFDPNRFREFHNVAWRNRNIHDVYEPGSTFKIVTAAAGLEEQIVTPSQMLDCGNGQIQVANVIIGEHDNHQYGLMSFEDVIVNSSNVGTVRVGLALGQQRMYDWIRRFGFGEKTGLPLPGEETGILRQPKKWSLVSPASLSIGQEISVTPLQVVRAVASVATGGMRVEPRIVEKVVDDEGKVIYEPPRPAPKRVMSEKTAAVLNEILKNVVSRGTGENAALAEHVVAGKTGTAQKASRGGYSLDRFVGSFAGYVPADRPRLVILVVVDDPRGQHYGGTVAAPVFREIAEGSLRYLGVPPSIPARSIGIEAPLLAAFSQSSKTAAEANSVPDLRSLDARAAIARAVSSGLTVRAIGSGVVTSQDPVPGGALPDNRQVTLKLSQELRMKLRDLLRDVPLRSTSGDLDTEITSVTPDSRLVKPGALFVAIPGTAKDGAGFIPQALEKGADGVVQASSLPLGRSPEGRTTRVDVDDPRAALSLIAANFYGRPAEKLSLVGVTGTSGKTTTTRMIESVFDASGEPVGLIGTIEYRAGDEILTADRTTPDAVVLQEWFAKMVAAGVRNAVMEVSSHALALKRTHGVKFAAAVFTNLSREHFDFHKDFESYFAAKRILFDQIDRTRQTAVVNIDDEYGRRLANELGATAMTFGRTAEADIHPADVDISVKGLRGTVITPRGNITVDSNLLGLPNLYNWLGAVGAALVVGMPIETIEAGIRNLKSVRGRFERVPSDKGPTVIVDYAHKPDALEKLLHAVREIAGERPVWVVFGCGGDRDRGKRPQMGEIASRLADTVIVTSDNPRGEKPEAIIKEIVAGAIAPVQQIANRREAIEKAIHAAPKDAVIVIAGKGHETYQVMGDEVIHFDDREEAEIALKKQYEKSA